ncbi:MAG TPA: DUF2971 domain-containing protein [Methylocella sp.]|nr:DUF2971 domain-containing protein [Methylocella sp.]
MTIKRPPPKLYKYCPFGVFALRALTEAEVFYCEPKNFNDPLDCKPNIEIDVDVGSLEKLCAKFLLQTHSEEAAHEKIQGCRWFAWDEHRESGKNQEDCYKKSLACEIKESLDSEWETKGVLCLSETWNSPLMWSHYADQHRGLCIEYDTSAVQHPTLGPVDYRSQGSIKASELVEWKLRGSQEAEQRVHTQYFFSKASQWRYEREWRDITAKSGAFDKSFPITGVHFGLKCDGSVITSIVRLLKDMRTIALYHVDSSNGSFKLERFLSIKKKWKSSKPRHPILRLLMIFLQKTRHNILEKASAYFV